MNGPLIWWKNFGRSFFRYITTDAFVRRTYWRTDGQTDRRTDISLITKTALHR